jgi:hypothetical protein
MGYWLLLLVAIYYITQLLANVHRKQLRIRYSKGANYHQEISLSPGSQCQDLVLNLVVLSMFHLHSPSTAIVRLTVCLTSHPKNCLMIMVYPHFHLLYLYQYLITTWKSILHSNFSSTIHAMSHNDKLIFRSPLLNVVSFLGSYSWDNTPICLYFFSIYLQKSTC